MPEINIINNNNNTNTNNNNNSNTGGNNTNTNNNTAPVTPVWHGPVTYPIQYTFPAQTPVYNPPTYYPANLSCAITASPSSIANGQTSYLSWSAPGATSAWLSDGIGAVQVNGTLVVRPNVSKTYTLTVSGQGGTNTCSTYVTVAGITPYVSLSQIPYTGLDLGPIGTMLYWLSILSFAVAGAYLVVYYKGGALALMSGALAGKQQFAGNVSMPTFTAPAPTVERVVAKPQKSVDAVVNLPVDVRNTTTDSMVVMHSKEGAAPRIVIARA